MGLTLSPRVKQVHRDQSLREFVDLSAVLPTGVTVASATVEWAQVTGVDSTTGGLTRTDRTALFGSPACTANPTAVPKSGGGTQGGAGWVAFTPAMDTDLSPGVYEMVLRVTLSNTEVVTYEQVWKVSGWGDPNES